MIKFPHTIKLVAELDENNPSTKALQALPEYLQHKLLEEAFIGALNRLSVFDTINEGSTWGIVKVDTNG